MSSTVDETDEGEDAEHSPHTGAARASSRVNGAVRSGTGRVTWADDEDSDNAYKNFKKRKSLNRRRTQFSKKASATPPESESTKGHQNRSHKRQRVQVSSSRAEKHDSRSTTGAAIEDESFMPSYLRERKTQFDVRREKLAGAGLRLPPCYDDIAFSDDERIANLKEKPALLNTKPSQTYRDRDLPHSLGVIPAPIAQWLRGYQLEGVAFLHRLFVYQTGGILGDDMGLGKTVQVIAFLTAAFGKTGDERDLKRMRKIRRSGSRWYPRVLVVCPGSLIENWKDEFERWGWWQVDLYHGAEKDEALQAAAAGRLEILITTYTMYRNNRSAINCVNWDCVVADECHMIKGQYSETTKAMNEVNALCRIGLTGTAIQNSYEELWVLLNWAVPGRFGYLNEWKKTISEPLRVGQSHEATLHQLGKSRKVAKALVENLLPPFFLRRMKTLIAHQLPKKNDRVVFCPLTSTQNQAYTAFIDSDVVQYILRAREDCDCGSGSKRGWCCYKKLPNGVSWRSYVFPAVTNLRKLASHLAILIPQGTDPLEKQAKDLELLKAAIPDEWERLYNTRGSIIHYSNPEYCGKWRVLKKLLKFWHDAGDKVLVFSHSVRLLRMLRQLFLLTAYNVSYLDGSMTYEARAQVVADYNSDPAQFVFLISTRAGGVGLNITAANKVVIVDPHWNPAHDLQAQDRAYRIGQSRDVDVFRLVSANTIEEIVYARQVYKQQQANIGYTASAERRYFAGVQHSETQKGEIFGMDNLFKTPSDHGVASVLEAIVHKTNVAEARAGVSVVSFDADFASTQDDDSPRLDETLEADPDDPLLVVDDPALADLKSLIAEDPEAADADTNSKAKANTKTQRVSAMRSDPVQAILAGAGVAYSHVNSEVIGSSRVEVQLSARAEATGNMVRHGERRLFQSQSGMQHDDDSGDDRAEAAFPVKMARFTWRYRPPEDVRRRQFCSMAKAWGYPTPTEFALVVEGWTSSQRRSALEQFYAVRRKELEKMERSRTGFRQRDTGSGFSEPSHGHVDEPGEPETTDEDAWEF